MKLVTCKNTPPVGVLLTVEYVKGDVEVTSEEGQANNLIVNNNVSFNAPASILRYLARAAPSKALYGQNNLQRSEVDHWLEFCTGRLSCPSEVQDALLYLDHVLGPVTFLVGHDVTIADLAVWGALRVSPLWAQLLASGEAPKNVARYYKFLSAQDKFAAVDKKVPGVKAPSQKPQQKERKEEGKFIDLPGAEKGKVVVRFPPEASGFLHVGHAKAALLNQYYQLTFEGKLVMRFDDTNPAKESSEFEQVILEDLKMLGIKPDVFTHTSDSFDLIQSYCEKMIAAGTAYCDNTEPEQMKKEREERTESVHRNNTPAQNFAMWEEMKAGTPAGQKCCVRAKIDMKSDNGCMRDPAMYRCKNEVHVRTGTKYKVYPTYDFACPIVDSVEGITHALRTTEYHDRDPQFYWFIDQLGLRKPYIWEYARLNLQNTVMSKRKLTWFVNEGIVDGWDDPRFPTVRGVLRRGMTVEGLKQFVIAQGSSRSVVMMDWEKIWSFNKKVIDPVAARYTALQAAGAVEVRVTGATQEKKQVQKHPKDPAVGMKDVWYGPKVMIEGADAEDIKEGDNVTFINWGNLLINKIHRTAGHVSSIDATANLTNTDFKKTQKVTWLAVTDDAPLVPTVCVTYDNIITKPILAKDDDFKDYVNRNTKTSVEMLGDPMLATLKKGDIIQLQRKGFYICDSPGEGVSRYSGRASPVVLFHIPDGHIKDVHQAGSKHKSGPAKAEPASAKEKAQSKKGKAAEKSPQEEQAPSVPGGGDLHAKVSQQGDKVRDLKAAKAPKDEVQAAVKVLLDLKAEYKKLNGSEWKPGAAPAPAKAAPAPASSDAGGLDAKITAQGNKVRDLKGAKAPKDEVQAAVKVLLDLKAEYKKATGSEWKPGATPAPAKAAPAPAPASSDAGGLDAKITAQGNKVRDLKGAKAPKDEVQAAVKVLLDLKAEYKKLNGSEWKPGAAPAPAKAAPAPASSDAGGLDAKITAQGNKVRDLKGAKAPKDEVQAAVKVLLDLKAEYKKANGSDWKPGAAPAPAAVTPVAVAKTSTAPAGGDPKGEELKAKIEAQGNAVRDLKGKKASKDEIDAAVKTLLDLKAQYKTVTGEDFTPAGGARQKKEKANKENEPKKDKGKKDKANKEKENKQSSDGGAAGREVKKVTRLGLEAKKEEDLPEWYSQVITKAEMIEYYDVSGCYVLRPWSFSIWERVHTWFDAKIKEMGFQNVYFPMFVSNAALQKEKDHIEDFAPEVAWVTRSGNSELAEPIAIRPTSETVMYPAYARWIQSHRDLPIKLNQWCNVVRWEFKHPQPFLRTREFLWQEGHSAYATYKEAEEEVYAIINLYDEIYEQHMAVPCVKGCKTEKEKFAGGDFTTTVEVYVGATGRGIQAATSHHLGQNFSKMFDLSFEDPASGEKRFAYQNSWAITTRSIGIIVLVHGDNKGLVLPPRMACIQIVVVPCGITTSLSEDDRKALDAKCEELVKTLKAAGIRAQGDYRDNYSPGWKFNHWELKGVPIRVELGPRDLKQGTLVAVRRDTGDKTTMKVEGSTSALSGLLDTIHDDMLAKALKERDDHMVRADTMAEFNAALDRKCMILSPFCGAIPCEEKIKVVSARDAVVEEGAPAMGAKGLCIPFKQPADITPGMKCVCPDCPCPPKHFTLFGRSY